MKYKNNIAVEDIAFADGGSGVAETFNRNTSTGAISSLNKIDATHLKFRSVDAEVEAAACNAVLANKFNNGLLNDTTLGDAVTDIGSDYKRLKLLSGTWTIADDLVIPSNIILEPEPGVIFQTATGKYLDIYGLVNFPYDTKLFYDARTRIYGGGNFKPEQWGAVGDGVTADTTAFQNFWTAINSRVTIDLRGNASYMINDKLPFGPQHCGMRINGNMAIIGGTGDSIYKIIFQNALHHFYNETDIYTMTGDYKIGDTEILLTAGGDDFSAGDWIYVRSNNVGITGLPIGELTRILSVSDNTLYLEFPLTKNYTNDGVNPHGVVPYNDWVIEDLMFENIHFKTLVRPSQLQDCYNATFKGCIVDSNGGLVLRGKSLFILHNTINVQPNFATTATRPYFGGCDVGTSDMVIDGNICNSTQNGMWHIHEGVSNCKLVNNTCSVGKVDTDTGEAWSVFSVIGYGFNNHCIGNTIINCPRQDAITFLYQTGGIISNNIIAGSMGRHGIREAACTGLSIKNNDLTGITKLNAVAGATTSFALQSASIDTDITGNQLPAVSTDVPNLFFNYPNTHTGIVKNNSNIGDRCVFTLPCDDFTILDGTPAMTLFRGNRNKAFAFDADSQEGISMIWTIPENVYNIIPELLWTNGGAGTGDVRWSVHINVFNEDDDMNVADVGINYLDTAPADSQDVLLKRINTISSVYVISVTPGQLITIRIHRLAAEVDDTLTNDALFLALRLHSLPYEGV